MGKTHEDMPELFDIAQYLEAVGQDLRQRVAAGEKTETLVMYGHKLWLLARRATSALDGLKSVLREEGVRRSEGATGSIEIDSPDGSRCTVIIPKPGLILKKGVDIESLKATLGTALFDRCFETVTTHKPRGDLRGDIAKMASAQPDATQAILEAVAVAEGTPKVYFKE